MQPLVFEITSARQMLEKAERELERFRASPHIDHAVNFCMTAYHIIDYVARGDEQSRIALIRSLGQQHEDFAACHLICNKAKHLVLRPSKKRQIEARLGETGGAMFGRMPLGTHDSMLGEGPRTCLVIERTERDFEPFALNVIQICKDILASRGL